MGRFHLRSGDYERAAKEFQHAANGPLPSDQQHRRDRLSFLFGYGAALGELGKFEEGEKILRQCIAFARNVAGAGSATACVANVPLADLLMKAGRTDEAAKLANEAYDALWKLGDPLFPFAVGTRAEALKAMGKADNPFADLEHLPDEMMHAAIANTLARAGKGDAGRVRAVLADLLTFVEKKFPDSHSITSDTLAAIAHHEAASGSKGDEKVHRTAVRRSVWSYAVTRAPVGLLANLEVGFDADGSIHLAPHLSRDANQVESEQLENLLNEAMDDLYSRPVLRP
jgi:tetratricopeptide (TPR) repeat protein